MIEWATNTKVNSEFYKTTMRSLRAKYEHIVGIENLTEYKEFEIPCIVEKILERKVNRILDFGTGTSCLPAYLNQNFTMYEVWALDDGSWHPEVNEKSYNNAYHTNIRYVTADILKNSDCVPDDYFDVIYSASVLEHVLHPEEYIKALDKKLKKGGWQIHLVDWDEVYHPLDFKKLTQEEIGDPPEDLYSPDGVISRIAICSQK